MKGRSVAGISENRVKKKLKRALTSRSAGLMDQRTRFFASVAIGQFANRSVYVYSNWRDRVEGVFRSRREFVRRISLRWVLINEVVVCICRRDAGTKKITRKR